MSQPRFSRLSYLKRLVLCAGALGVSAGVAGAQSAPVAPSFVSTNGRLPVNSGNGEVLFGLEQQRDLKTIELDLTQAQLRQSPQAWSGLSRWVASGGVVLLHTDAAQLFGFRTITARERTRERAGQLFGRARAALPFAASPLLWGGVSQTNEGRGRGALGVYLVYYQLQTGDQLALGHGAGIPLLSVTDLSSAPNQPPLYAAMMAPYGNGWAIVLPRFIEARADGTTFSRNLAQFIGDLPGADSRADAWTSVSARAIETARAQAQRGALPASALSRAFAEALQPLPPKQWPSDKLPAIGAYQRPIAATPPAPENEDASNEDAAAEFASPATQGLMPRLLMRRSEASALARLFASADEPDADAQNGDVLSSKRAMLELLAARVALQRGQAPGSQVPDVARSPQWFINLIALSSRERQRLAPTVERTQDEPNDDTVAQMQLWNGLLTATAANAFGADASSRAAAWREALHWWNLALGQPLEPLSMGEPFVAITDAAPPMPAFAPAASPNDRWLASVSTSTLKQWQKLARWEFAKALREAPMTLAWLGPNGEQNAINMFPVDAAVKGVKTPIVGNEYPSDNSFLWRLVQRTVQLLDSGVRGDLGWGADQTEVKLTPGPWLYEDYGGGGIDWTDMTKDYDVRLSDNRILLWSAPTLVKDVDTGIETPTQHFVHVEQDPANPYDVIYTTKPLEQRIRERVDKMRRESARSKLGIDEEWIQTTIQAIIDGESGRIAAMLGFQEARTPTVPYHVMRLHRSLAMQALTQGGTAAPPWLQEGLENITGVSLAVHAKAQGIYPVLPPELQHEHPAFGRHTKWQNSVVRAAASYNSHLDYKPLIGDPYGYGGVVYGPPALERPATRQVQFFYQQFGKGAVVETLQRLGTGQNIDEALQATTGLNQQGFMARWQQWDAAPQTTAARAAEAATATVEPDDLAGEPPTTGAAQEQTPKN